MSSPSGTDNDPSMDDILASIRKIISDDEARAQVGQGIPTAGPQTGVYPVLTPRAEPAANRDDVLLLTDLIEEPKSDGPDGSSTPISMTTIDPMRATEMPQPNISDPLRTSHSSTSQTGESSLVGAGVVGATSSAFERLNQAIEDRKPTPTPIDPGPMIAADGKTVEDLVKEMLRPMLKEWLDRNLPPLVERLVEREISRLTLR